MSELYDLVSERADYPARDGQPDRTLVICSHPRSGSTLLGEAIYAAGGLGCPLEYLHRGFRPSFAQRWQAHDLDSYASALHRFRTDTTGVFSLKLFWRDVDEIVAEAGGLVNVARRILPNPTFVYLTRRDRVRQAISAFIAVQTNVFRRFAPDDSIRDAIAYDYQGILRQLAVADYANARWRAFFWLSGIEPYRIAYEDLASRYEEVAGSLLAHLGRPGPPASPRLRRQATAQTEEFVLRFLKDHQADRPSEGG